MAADPLTGLPPVRTDAQLQDAAGKSVDASLAPQISGITDQNTLLGNQKTAAAGEVGNMFDTLQPYVSGAAEQIRNQANQAFGAQTGIFQAAGERLNQLAQQNAQRAQALSQEIGGPVRLSEFTSALDPVQNEFVPTAAGALMHGLSNAETASAEAGAFSQRVFPTLRTELTSRSNAFYDDQIRTNNQKISDLQAQRTGMVDSKLTELQTAERAYAVNRAQVAQAEQTHNETVREFNQSQDQNRRQFAATNKVEVGKLAETTREFNKTQKTSIDQFNKTYAQNRTKLLADIKNQKGTLAVAKGTLAEQVREFGVKSALDKLTANRDYNIAKQTLNNELTKTGIAQQQLDLTAKQVDAELTGTYDGAPTAAMQRFKEQMDLQKQQMTVQQEHWAATLQMTKDQYASALVRLQQNGAKISSQIQHRSLADAYKVMDAALHPAGSTPVLQSVRREIPELAATQAMAKGKTNVYQDPTTKKYYTFASVHIPPDTWAAQTGNQPLRDPNQMYHLVTTTVPGISGSQAANLVRQRLEAAGVNIRKDWKPGNDWRVKPPTAPKARKAAAAAGGGADTGNNVITNPALTDPAARAG